MAMKSFNLQIFHSYGWMFCLEKLILHLFYLLCNAAISTDTNLKLEKPSDYSRAIFLKLLTG